MKDIETLNLHAKHRPLVMSDFVGQEATVKTFKSWIKTKKFPATILISGLTGSGKTTFARLIERYLNCKTFDACGKCDMCKQQDRQNVTTVNAVSDGKKDDIRHLIEIARFAPPSGRKRVIIIDEVHALQKQSEESLLVPIEEPSKNTVWILCTSDPDQVRSTIKNRCTRLTINPIEPEIIADRLYDIVKAEKIKLKDKKQAKKTLKLIASFSDGQMRNGISHVQALLGSISSGEKLDESSILNHIMEGTDQTDLKAAQLFIAMCSYNLFDTIKIINSVQDVRGLVTKLHYLVDWFVQSSVGAIKYTPVLGKLYKEELRKLKGEDKKQHDKTLKAGLPFFINVQDVCLEILRTLNSVSIPERGLVQTWLAKTVVADYKFTVNR